MTKWIVKKNIIEKINIILKTILLGLNKYLFCQNSPKIHPIKNKKTKYVPEILANKDRKGVSLPINFNNNLSEKR